MAEMAPPVARTDRPGNKPIGGRRVGDTQQSLSKAEQQDPLLARKCIFMEERVDPALLMPLVARNFDQVAGEKLDAAAFFLGEASSGDQAFNQRAFLDKQSIADRFPAW